MVVNIFYDTINNAAKFQEVKIKRKQCHKFCTFITYNKHCLIVNWEQKSNVWFSIVSYCYNAYIILIVLILCKRFLYDLVDLIEILRFIHTLITLTFLYLQYGDTPIHTAARYGHAGVARILMSAKCNTNLQNKVRY